MKGVQILICVILIGSIYAQNQPIHSTMRSVHSTGMNISTPSRTTPPRTFSMPLTTHFPRANESHTTIKGGNSNMSNIIPTAASANQSHMTAKSPGPIMPNISTIVAPGGPATPGPPTMKPMQTNSTPSINVTTTTMTTLSTTPAGPSILTNSPAAPGEYQSMVRMECTFTAHIYTSRLEDRNSIEFRNFSNSVFTPMQTSLASQMLRLIEIMYNSLRNGSVVANMTLKMASNTSIPDANLTQKVQSAVFAAFRVNATPQVLQGSTLIVTTAPPSGTQALMISFYIVTLATALGIIFGKYN